MTAPMFLGDLTFPKVKALLESGAVALWPTGSTEAHGPHLPLSTDVLIATETCRRAVAAVRERTGLDALILPPLAFTITDYAAPFSGTISIPKETAVAYVRDVVLGASRHGFKCVCLVNAHLEPAHRYGLRDGVKAAADAECPVVIADPCDRRWVTTLTEELQSGQCHAGQYESSLIMAIEGAPIEDGVRAELPERAIDLIGGMKAGKKDFLEMGATEGYFGRPAEASIAEGHATYEKLVDMVATTVQEALA
ncbi:MAG: creatininase family protein [Deltaproteobacteria bacterium]